MDYFSSPVDGLLMVAANDRSRIREPCMVDYHVRRSHEQKSAYRKRPFERPCYQSGLDLEAAGRR